MTHNDDKENEVVGGGGGTPEKEEKKLWGILTFLMTVVGCGKRNGWRGVSGIYECFWRLNLAVIDAQRLPAPRSRGLTGYRPCEFLGFKR